MGEFFTTTRDAKADYEKYLNKKISRKDPNLLEEFKEIEIEKYHAILIRLRLMLANEKSYNEKHWQVQILQIILLMYTRYIRVFENVPIKGIDEEKRYLDYLLVDVNGYADVIEIKKPFDNCIVSSRTYRENHIPLHELSGAIMQLEKYLLGLNRWGASTEKALNEKYKDSLPAGVEIKIVNPGGIIIMGREHNLTTSQKKDFEVIKRKFKNVFDIITYDNLIFRLEATISQLKMR
ncbi:Shedu immune nuclease family protein [Chitinophaga sp. LS1]|uniref:Shedu immune nuclease family protein n=1 Tax=Chitinophaga sp. LS1 TaxID=3051176 RepID=UPI002AAAA9B7|nr:Shedu immune nuclease family protein [Chitinophaga sp. LS1]WPV64003.1 DUF4263 domain-containing protein [Chitinophaga sp. LS1]